MDLLQDQVTLMNVKIDGLQRAIEQVGNQVTELFAELKTVGGERHTSHQSGLVGHYTQTYGGLESMLEHKDILLDSGYPESELQSGERQLAPEIQIQRLTAQLTAAYNRIAALEEQLLAKRIQ